MKLSVLICTYNRAHLLRQCLEALASCDPLPDEVVVVNGGTDEAPDVVDAFVRQFPALKRIDIVNVGLAHSQNTGAPHCTGDIIATLDDDAFVHPDWVDAIKRSHEEHPEAGGIGGKTLNAFPDNAVARFEEATAFAPNQKGDGDRAVEVRTVAGVNMSYKRPVMEFVGRFDETLPAGMDVDYNWRVRKAGYKILYDPSIVVAHHNRTRLKAFLKQQFWYGRGYYLNRRKWPDLWSALPSGWWGLKSWYKLFLLLVGPLLQSWQGFTRARTFKDRFIFPLFGMLKDICWKAGAFSEARNLRFLKRPLKYIPSPAATKFITAMFWTGILIASAAVPYWNILGRRQSRLVVLIVFACLYVAFLWARPKITGIAASMTAILLISLSGIQYQIPETSMVITALDVLVLALLFLTAFRLPRVSSPGTGLLNLLFPLLWVSVLGILIALWRGVYWYHWLTMLKGFLFYAIFAWLITRLISTRRELQWVVISLIIVQTGITALEYLIGRGATQILADSEATEIVRRGGALTGGTINTYASYVMTLVVFSMALFIRNLTRIKQWAYLLPSFVGLAALHSTYTRASWLGAIVGLAVILSAWGRRGIVIGVLGCILLAFLIPKDVWERISSTSQESGTVKRVRLRNTALAVAGQYPLFGAGWGSGFYLDPSDKLVSAHLLPWWHNDHLAVLTQLGIVGLAAWLYFWARLLWIAYRCGRRMPDPFLKAVVLGSLSAVLAMLVHATFDLIVWRPETAPHMWFLVGLMLTAINLAARESRQEPGARAETYTEIKESLAGAMMYSRK